MPGQTPVKHWSNTGQAGNWLWFSCRVQQRCHFHPTRADCSEQSKPDTQALVITEQKLQEEQLMSVWTRPLYTSCHHGLSAVCWCSAQRAHRPAHFPRAIMALPWCSVMQAFHAAWPNETCHHARCKALCITCSVAKGRGPVRSTCFHCPKFAHRQLHWRWASVQQRDGILTAANVRAAAWQVHAPLCDDGPEHAPAHGTLCMELRERARGCSGP